MNATITYRHNARSSLHYIYRCMRASPLCMRHHQHRYLWYYSDLCSTGAIRLQWRSCFIQLFNDKFRSIVRASDKFPKYFYFSDNRSSTHTRKWNSKLYNGVFVILKATILFLVLLYYIILCKYYKNFQDSLLQLSYFFLHNIFLLRLSSSICKRL